MVKRFFITVISLMIALQSVASIADTEQLSHPTMLHHGHSQEAADFESKNLITEQPTEKPNHSDHCHHSHSCFHMVLIGTLPDTPDLAAGILLPHYQANLPLGIHSSPFRPPIA
ncbi:MAG: hypothetical protein RLN96_02695 [Pseudomonadales bacterium]